jgi:copper transport protein
MFESKNNAIKFNVIFVIVFTTLFAITISTTSMLSDDSNIAHAHSFPVTEVPAANSIIPKGVALPSQVVIDFSERPDPNVSTIQVTNSRNERVDKGDFVITGDHDRQAMTTLDTRKLTDGVYTVSWMTQSNDDGHLARGSYVFGIGNVGPGATTTASSFNGALNQRQPQVTAVTSNLDGIIKWPLIVSQAAIVGGIFSHFFLWEKFGSRVGQRRNVGDPTNNNDKGASKYNKANLFWMKRFSIILVASSVAIVASASSSIFLQVIELSPNNSIFAYLSVFKSILHGSAGTTWLVQTITAVAIIACSLGYYYLSKRQILAGDNTIEGNRATKQEQQQQDPLEKSQVKGLLRKINMAENLVPMSRSGLLRCALVMGAISIFASSANSHNAGVSFLPSVAVFIDWLHFMAVSTWIGGLFYISAVLLSAIRYRSYITRTKTKTHTAKTSDLIVYYLAILLPRFSLIATVSLGVIGISGLYMGWIQLHSFNNLLATPYGNILVIKLSAISPLVILGAYHQLKVHRTIVAVAKLGISNIGSQINEKSIETTIQKLNIDNYNDYTNPVDNNKPFNNNEARLVRIEKHSKIIYSKFTKTIKIESLLAISILLIASLLTITSPPSKISSMAMMSMSGSFSPSSSPSSTTMAGMPMPQAKNSTFVKQKQL